MTWRSAVHKINNSVFSHCGITSSFMCLCMLKTVTENSLWQLIGQSVWLLLLVQLESATFISQIKIQHWVNNSPIFTGSPFKVDLRKDESKAVVLRDNTKHFIVEGLQWSFLQALGYYLPVGQLTMYITGYYGNKKHEFGGGWLNSTKLVSVQYK